MPNIAITSFCNLKCKYCFAEDMKSTQQSNVSLEKFKEILQWISKTPTPIGLIGGEPTIHPNIKEILIEINRYSRETRMPCTIFTNGIYLEELIPYIGQQTGILINVNSPASMPEISWTKLNESLNKLNELGWFTDTEVTSSKAHLGCNIHKDCLDYSFIWDLVDKYKLSHIRMSVVAPMNKEDISNKERYFTLMKPIFMEFVKNAKKHNCQLHEDCSQIPLCYFSKDELDEINKVMPVNFRSICEPVVDITPNFTASACFGSYEEVECDKFDNVLDLQRYLLFRKTFPKYELNATGKCAKCKNHEMMICQGGCLSFSKAANGKKDCDKNSKRKSCK